MFDIENNEKQKLSLSGASSEPIISAESLYCHARPRSGISAESKRDPRLIATQSPRMTGKALSFLRLRGASGAQEISTSALCCEAHKRRFIFNLIRRTLEKFFKKNFRDDSFFMASPKDSLHRHPERSEGSIKNNIKDWILRFADAQPRMTIPALALIFTLITTAESRAKDCINSSNKKVTCIDRLTDENGNNSCGTNCTFRVVEENGKQVLHVYKKDISKPATIREGAFSKKFYADRNVLDAQGKSLPLENIMLDNDFENIGSYAFAESAANISSASGKFLFGEKTGNYIVWRGSVLNGDVFLYDVGVPLEESKINGNVVIAGNNVSPWNFVYTSINGNLIISDSVKAIRFPSLSKLRITGQIYCASGVENCYDMMKRGCDEDNSCLTSLDNLMKSNKFSAYPDGCLSMGAKARCTKCKSASFKLEDDGWCLRKIYTPAEAAEVLKDDNNNSVTITFKK